MGREFGEAMRPKRKLVNGALGKLWLILDDGKARQARSLSAILSDWMVSMVSRMPVDLADYVEPLPVGGVQQEKQKP